MFTAQLKHDSDVQALGKIVAIDLKWSHWQCQHGISTGGKSAAGAALLLRTGNNLGPDAKGPPQGCNMQHGAPNIHRADRLEGSHSFPALQGSSSKIPPSGTRALKAC